MIGFPMFPVNHDQFATFDHDCGGSTIQKPTFRTPLGDEIWRFPKIGVPHLLVSLVAGHRGKPDTGLNEVDTNGYLIGINT